MRCIYYNLWVIACLTMVVTTSCRKDFEYTQSSGQLQFSKDTVYLDTIFTNIGSSTYSLKVYNRSSEDLRVPYIGLQNGQESKYRINVDGVSGNEFTDIPLLAKDSMFIFVETTFDIATVGQNEFLHTDAIQFGTGDTQQEVQLVTLVRDAVFLYPRTLSNGMRESLLLGTDNDGNEIRIEGFFLEDGELNFTNEKPYVIYGYAAVPEGSELIIDAGARIHFHKNSGILVSQGASLKANGLLSEDQDALENEIIFEGDRLEPEFSEVSGQWGTIWFLNGSIDNLFEYVTIKNATVGMLVDGDATGLSPTLTFRNSQIHNSSSTNMWGRNTSITAENSILGSAGEVSLYCNLGGNYNFKHSTIANYWSNGFRNGPALLIDNFIETNDDIQTEDLISASFSNSIIYGNRSLELQLRRNESSAFNFAFSNCLIRFDDTSNSFVDNALYDFGNGIFYNEILLNLDPEFLDVVSANFEVKASSPAIDFGNLETAQEVPLDLLGRNRTETPDLGALEFSPDM